MERIDSAISSELGTCQRGNSLLSGRQQTLRFDHPLTGTLIGGEDALARRDDGVGGVAQLLLHVHGKVVELGHCLKRGCSEGGVTIWNRWERGKKKKRKEFGSVLTGCQWVNTWVGGSEWK